MARTIRSGYFLVAWLIFRKMNNFNAQRTVNAHEISLIYKGELNVLKDSLELE